MKMKRWIVLVLALSLLLCGCVNAMAEDTAPTDNTVPETTAVPETVAAEETEAVRTITPLPDDTMENLTDAILAVSLEEGGAYVDDQGIMQMDLKIFTYDQYDMVDIASVNVGDTIVRHSGETKVTSCERTETGAVWINGGLDNGGFELVTQDSGTFYEMGFNDHKNWYEAGEATIRVSADLIFTDNADLDLGEMIFYPGSFLIGEVTNYDFTPYNTTVRVEAGQIIEMHRRYIP